MMSPALDAIAIEGTRRCNLNCRYCYAAEGRSYSDRLKKELKTDEIKDLLRQARDLHVNGITWTGGEFLIRRDALELLATAARFGMVSHVVTNATLLTEHLVHEIKLATRDKVFFSFSLNSLDAVENLWSRDDTPSTVLQVMEICEAFDVAYSVLLTIGKFSLDSLGATLRYFQDRGILVVRSPLTARGKGRSYFAEFAISREQMQSVVHPALRESPVAYVSFTPSFVSPELAEREGQVLGMLTPGCYIGRGVAISPEGDVGLCPSMLDDLVIGNVREASLKEITSSEYFASLTDRGNLKGKCGRCRYKHTCGGCRAMAFYRSGDYFAEDPLCFFEPKDETTRSEFEELCTRKYAEFLDLPSSIHLLFASRMLDGLPIPAMMRKPIVRTVIGLVGIGRLRRLLKVRAGLKGLLDA